MPSISFRPIVESDHNFLSAVYASTREQELALVDWDDGQKAGFLEMQFSAQHQYYQAHYKQTDFLIIFLENVPIGRFYIAAGRMRFASSIWRFCLNTGMLAWAQASSRTCYRRRKLMKNLSEFMLNALIQRTAFIGV